MSNYLAFEEFGDLECDDLEEFFGKIDSDSYDDKACKRCTNCSCKKEWEPEIEQWRR
jgi:hypothetical protein